MNTAMSSILYLVSGTYNGGVDVVPPTNVGISNHMTLHNLKLQDGHSYFATVRGTLENCYVDKHLSTV